MKKWFPLLCLLAACNTPAPKPALEGSWRLISGTIIERNDTTITDYTNGKSFIKILNGSHFAFTGHDLQKGKDSATAFFVSGAGTYTVKDSVYTEVLEYCTDRQWEGNAFHFAYRTTGDTLVITGTEKVAGTDINRLNIERYTRVK